MNSCAVCFDCREIDEGSEWDIEAEKSRKFVERFVQDLGCAIDKPAADPGLAHVGERAMSESLPKERYSDAYWFEPECEWDSERLERDQGPLRPHIVRERFVDALPDCGRLGEQARSVGSRSARVVYRWWSEHGGRPMLRV